jgi:hypothetical protein
MSFGDQARGIIEERGFVRAMEPAVGGGAMVIALARALRAQGINYQQHLHVTAVDIDIRAVHMAYAQLSLLHIPAMVIHGDTLRIEEWSHWRTPAHFLGGWDYRLAAQSEAWSGEICPAPAPETRTAAPDDKPAGAQLSLF